MTSSYDPGDTFPVTDGIGPLSPPTVPPGFDLTQILSDSMRARPPWLDMATVASKVLYDYVEKSRIALELSRDPEHLGRALKIATLRMMGLEWNSNNLTDEDYNRVIKSISLYNAGHGPVDFVSFMGYALGIPLDMLPLWTQDYGTFVPGPPITGDTIFDNPANQMAWYPTTHVGLLYEEFAAGADALDLDDLKALFYKMAPINLVLEWIAAEITLRVGPLVANLGFFLQEEDTLQIGWERPVTVITRVNAYEDVEEFGLELVPTHPQSASILASAIFPLDAGMDSAVATGAGTAASAGRRIPIGVTIDHAGEFVPSGDGSGGLTIVQQPTTGWRPPWNQSIYGGLSRPARYQYSRFSHNPVPWVGGSILPAIAVFADGQPCPLVTAPAATPYTTLTVPSGSHTVCWVVRPEPTTGGTLPTLTLRRGTDAVTFNPNTLVVTPGVSGNPCGALAMGDSGFYLFWARMVGDQVRVDSGLGSVSWYNLSVDDGGYPTLPTLSSNHAALSYSSAWSVTSPDIAFPNGILLLRLTAVFPEWLVANQILLDARNPTGEGILLDVDSSGSVGLTPYTPGGVPGTRVSLGTISSETKFGVALKWTPSGVTATLNGAATPTASPWPANLRLVGVLHEIGHAPTSLWVINRILAIGATDASQLPSDATLSWLTQHN
jgi:hypothetical protein